MVQNCPICEGKLSKNVSDKTFTYKGEKITISNYVTYKCGACGESIVDNTTLKNAGKILKDFQRKVEGLLTGEQIKKIRLSLNLTQEEMSEILGGGLKAFARYESGSIAQSRAMDNLLRILDKYPSVLPVIRKRKPGTVSNVIDFQPYLKRTYKNAGGEEEANSENEYHEQIR